MPGPGMELIGEEEIQEVMEVLRSGYLFRYGVSLGADVDPRFKGKVYKVEQEIANYCGLRHAVAVNSGTSALLTALSGLVTLAAALVSGYSRSIGMTCFVWLGLHQYNVFEA